MSILGSLISAGSSLIGGLLGRDEAKDNIKMQLAFAKNGIQWKAQDALKAGIHPLYAMGAPTMSFQNVVSGMPEAVANAGQDISRAVAAGMDEGQKSDAYTTALRALQLQRGGLENELLRTQIAKLNAPGTPPSMPGPRDRPIVDGQGDTRAPITPIEGITLRPRKSESPAQDVEDEYGEAADFVGAVRMARDASPAVQNFVAAEWNNIKRGTPTWSAYVSPQDADDLRRVYLWWTGQPRPNTAYKSDFGGR